jgi:hypothetical protein
MRIPLLLVVAFSAVGCVSEGDPRLTKAATLENDVLLLKTKVDVLERENTVHSGQITNLAAKAAQLEVQSHSYASAWFDPTLPGSYRRIDTSAGTFLVSVENVTPYLDGFRVECRIGNPAYATFNGFTLKASWGPHFKEGDDFAKWQASSHAKDITLLDRLLPGTWNKVTLVCSPQRRRLSSATSDCRWRRITSALGDDYCDPDP